MLCLTRLEGQRLIFTVAPSTEETEFTVKFLDRARNGQRIRLGVEAPDSVRVLRAELLEKKPE